MANNTDIQSATPESVWAFLRKIPERQAETDKNLKVPATDDEFDVVMLNGHSVGIVVK